MEEPKANDDDQHLRLLAIFHYVLFGFTALFGFLPLFYVVVGCLVLHAPPPKHGEPPPAFLGWLFIGVGVIFFLLAESFAVCVFAAGRFIKSRKAYWFIFVIACLQCAFFPFGTVLGVFTIMVLSRLSVKGTFGLVSTAGGKPL